MEASFSNFITKNKAFNTSIMIIILLNVFSIMLETVSSLNARFGIYFYWFNLISVIIFTIEYFLRLLAHKERLLQYIFSFYALVDLIAILPFYLPFLIVSDLRFLRLLRLLRIFRIVRTTKYTIAFNLMIDVVRDKKRELWITFYVSVLFMLVSAFLVYFFENPAQPDQFSNLFDSSWWALATLTTIGYGDIYPITIGGKIIAGFLAILGIGIVAMPTGILASGMMEKISGKKTCPHCGKEI